MSNDDTRLTRLMGWIDKKKATGFRHKSFIHSNGFTPCSHSRDESACQWRFHRGGTHERDLASQSTWGLSQVYMVGYIIHPRPIASFVAVSLCTVQNVLTGFLFRVHADPKLALNFPIVRSPTPGKVVARHGSPWSTLFQSAWIRISRVTDRASQSMWKGDGILNWIEPEGLDRLPTSGGFLTLTSPLQSCKSMRAG
jgi:hypothetical protein